MAGNIIHITFNQDLPVGSNLFLSGLYNNGAGGNTPLNPNWDWVVLRNAAFRVTTGTPTTLPGERSAINFMQAFLLDYGGTGQHTAVRDGKTVTITSLSTNVAGYTWEGGMAFLPSSGGFPSLADVKFSFTVGQNNSPFTATVEYLPNLTDRCRFVQVKITASHTIAEIHQPVTNLSVNNTVYIFTYARGSAGNIVITSNQTQPITITQPFQTPAVLTPQNFTLNTTNSPNGASIAISYVNQNGLTFTYAISPPNTSPTSGAYQTSNIFSGLAPGDYWLSIKDQFGCIKTKAFTVEEVGNGLSAYFWISKAMSFRFANRITWGDAANYKTDENTLSCEVDARIAYKEIQQFQTADVITTQFKSNYSQNFAYVIKANGDEIQIPVLQKTNFMGVKDRRDGVKISLGNNQTGFYFNTGNIYNYDTGVVTSQHALNGTLPYWATVGQYFTAEGVWYQILDIIFDEALMSDVIVVMGNYAGTPALLPVGSIYNVFNFEVYEFTIDLVDYQDQRIQVRINNNDPDFGNLAHLSELIHVKVRHEDTVEIRYSNPENTDVYYSTGITNLIRLPLTAKKAVPEGSSENYKTDTSVYLLGSEVYEADQFVFEPVTREIMRKLIQALNHKTLQMDGVFYVLNGQPEWDGPLDLSNLYVVRATLIKAGGAFNSTSGSGNDIFDTTNTEIQGLLDIGTGTFLEYN